MLMHNIIYEICLTKPPKASKYSDYYGREQVDISVGFSLTLKVGSQKPPEQSQRFKNHRRCTQEVRGALPPSFHDQSHPPLAYAIQEAVTTCLYKVCGSKLNCSHYYFSC